LPICLRRILPKAS